MGFLPLSSHVLAAPINSQETRTTDQECWNTDQGPMSPNCVSIVAELRQNLGVARCRDCSFNAKKVSRWVSRFASKCRDLCQSVAGRLESFYYRANIGSKVRQYVHNRDTSRHFFSIRDSIATPKVSRCFA